MKLIADEIPRGNVASGKKCEPSAVPRIKGGRQKDWPNSANILKIFTLHETVQLMREKTLLKKTFTFCNIFTFNSYLFTNLRFMQRIF
jgi:hypothetical protein